MTRYAEAFPDISWRASEEGTIELAGVQSFAVEETGRLVVELDRAGDFARDPVLRLRVPVVVESDGALAVGGLERLSLRGDTIVLRFEDSRGDSGAIAATQCTMRKPIPCGNPYCGGIGCDSTDACSWKIDDVDLICDCVPAR
jgi:hypothetical protein